jgi:hypothetical protein
LTPHVFFKKTSKKTGGARAPPAPPLATAREIDEYY